MRINNIDYSISFNGHNSLLKDMYKDGKLPTVKIGLYGGKLKEDNVSFEHIKPKSLGGSATLKNGALATRENNSARGNKDINLFLTKEMLHNYLVQFQNVVVKYKGKIFIGNKYILDIINTLKNIGFKI